MQTVSHEMYLHQLRNAEENHITVRRIGQVMHTVLTFEQRKRGLCGFDDKRYLLEDRIDTLAHGHYRIRDNQQANDDDGPEHHQQQHEQRQQTQASNGNGGGDGDGGGVSAFVDDDGDEHLVATQRAVAERPVLQSMFAGDNDDDDDNDDDGHDDNGNRGSRGCGGTRVSNSNVNYDLSTAPLMLPTVVTAAAAATAVVTTLIPCRQPQLQQQQQVQQQQLSVQPTAVAAVSVDALAAAKSTLFDKRRFTEHDFQAAELLVNTTFIGLENPLMQGRQGVEAIKRRLLAHADAQLSGRAIQLLESAHASDKMRGLSDVEQLLFVAVKSAKVVDLLRHTSTHKLLFMHISGRSANWWASNHTRMLHAIPTYS